MPDLQNSIMIKFLSAFLFIPIFFITAKAQSPDDSVKHSPVRTLSYPEYEAYLKGEAADDMAKVAEINHYPLPDQVLKWRNELDLSPVQRTKITEINVYMHRRRLQTGGSIISNERTLDSLFRTGKIDDGTLIFYANRFGLYQGELRNAILQACFATAKLLSPQQITRLESLQKGK
jgi:hypothetical protein